MTTVNSAGQAEAGLARRRKSSVWSLNAESRTDHGFEMSD